jgi:hypothetical protein
MVVSNGCQGFVERDNAVMTGSRVLELFPRVALRFTRGYGIGRAHALRKLFMNVHHPRKSRWCSMLQRTILSPSGRPIP